LLRSEEDSEHALQLWRSDSALLEQQYLSLQRGVEARYRPKIEKKPEMAASQAAEISVLQRRKTNALLDAGKRRDDRLAQISSDRRDALNRIGEANRTAASVVSARTDRFGGGLAWFTLIALGVFVFSIGIEEVHRKGAGITEVVVPGQYDFLPNLFGELQFAIENRLNYRLRAKIREFEALTPLLEELETKPAWVTTSKPPLVPNPYMKPCKQCGKPYPERTKWQLFCCNPCRMAYHQAKHGRPYLPHKVYRAKLKEMNGTKMNLFED
jgi:hypothetical protein